MRTAGVTALVLCLAAVVCSSDPVYYREANGSWAKMEAAVRDGRLEIKIAPQAAPNGEAILVINKPEWMVLDDSAAPTLSGIKVNGTSRPSSTSELNLGCLADASSEVIIGIKDDKNPIAADAVFRLNDAPDVSVEIDRSGLGPASTSARMVVKMSGLAVGKYEGTLSLADMAPLRNRASWPVSFTVMGISVSEDKQTVSLANATAGFRLQPDISKQLLLPNGAWSKLTTHIGAFLYPREFTDVQITKDTEAEKTVLVTAICQDLDGKPNDGNIKLEYELTVRQDTPALLVTTRSINISDKELGISPNWGWLSCPYYFTAEGKQEWGSGEDKERYHNIGTPGWVWLAPAKGGETGLLWVSADSFGEFMGGSLLLYGPRGKRQSGEFSEMKFAFAAAETPAEAEEIYNDLVEKGLVTPPEKEK
jgi:hypothetical protein